MGATLIKLLNLPSPDAEEIPERRLRATYDGFLRSSRIAFDGNVVVCDPRYLSVEVPGDAASMPDWQSALPPDALDRLLLLSVMVKPFDPDALWPKGRKRFLSVSAARMDFPDRNLSLAETQHLIRFGINTPEGRLTLESSPGLLSAYNAAPAKSVIETLASELISEVPGVYAYQMWQICDWSARWAIVFGVADAAGEYPFPWLLGFIERTDLERNFVALMREGSSQFDFGFYSTLGEVHGDWLLGRIAFVALDDADGADREIVDQVLALDPRTLAAFRSEASWLDTEEVVRRLRGARDLANELELSDTSLAKLFIQCGFGPNPLSRLESYLTRLSEDRDARDESEALARAKTLAPFNLAIRELCAATLGPGPQTYMGGLAHRHRMSTLIRFVEDFVVERGQLPEGRVEVPRLGSVQLRASVRDQRPE